MKRLCTVILLLAAVLLVVRTVSAIVIKDRPTAFSNGSDIVVRWNTSDESGVQRFDVMRRNGFEGDFVLAGSIDQLKGNNSSYEFVDRAVFKSAGGIYQYKIRVVNGQSPAPESEIVTVSHVSSAAKRTWGSIKAMFR